MEECLHLSVVAVADVAIVSMEHHQGPGVLAVRVGAPVVGIKLGFLWDLRVQCVNLENRGKRRRLNVG